LVQDPPLKLSGIKRRGGVLTRPVKIPGSTTRILKYVEDLKRGANAEIGPKDYFEIASSKYRGDMVPVVGNRCGKILYVKIITLKRIDKLPST
jgi:hypothetical protein